MHSAGFAKAYQTRFDYTMGSGRRQIVSGNPGHPGDLAGLGGTGRSLREQKKTASERSRPEGRSWGNKPGDFLLSHTLARAVPSGLRGLTAVFGMGTGGSLSLWSPRTGLTKGRGPLS